MSGGIENDVFRVTFRSGATAVAHVYRSKTSEQVMAEIRLLRLLRGKVRIPSLIEPARGGYPLDVDGHPLTLTTFIVGRHIERAAFTSEMFARVGSSLRQVHDGSRGPCLRRYWGVPEVIDKSQLLVDLLSGRSGVRSLRRVLERETEAARWATFEHSSDCMIHADPDQGNLITDPSGNVWLLDFDDCGYAPAPLDVGIALRNLVIKRLVRDGGADGLAIEDAADALLGGYGRPFARLGSWVRLACFRHAVLMLQNWLYNRSYPNRNRDNFEMLEYALAAEQRLNSLALRSQNWWPSKSPRNQGSAGVVFSLS